MNTKNRKTFKRHKFILNPKDKINVKRFDKYSTSSNFSIYGQRLGK